MRRLNPHAPGRWFHGTTLDAAERILETGRVEAPKELAPHYTGRTAKWFAPMEGYVYLTNDVVLGLQYANMRTRKRGRYGTGALIEVVPDEPCLPDEDEIGQALAIVLFDDQSQPVDDRDAMIALGRAVIASVPRGMRQRWEASASRVDGWTGARKAKEGKAAVAALPPDVLGDLAMKTRSIACSGARAVRAVAVPPDFHRHLDPFREEELQRRAAAQGIDRRSLVWADYKAANLIAYPRFFDESPSIEVRKSNPVASPRIDHPGLLERMARVEGDAWRRYQLGRPQAKEGVLFQQAAWRSYRSDPSLSDIAYFDYLAMAHEAAPIIYGEGGYARYAVRSDGEVVLLEWSARPEKIELARRAGFRIA